MSRVGEVSRALRRGPRRVVESCTSSPVRPRSPRPTAQVHEVARRALTVPSAGAGAGCGRAQAVRNRAIRGRATAGPGATFAWWSPSTPNRRALSVEVAAVRWRAPDGAFAVLAGVSEEGEEVVARRRARPRPRGRVGRRAGRLAAPSAPRLALRGRARPRRGARQRAGAARLPGLGQARRAARGAVAARAPRPRAGPRRRRPRSRRARCARCPGIGPARIGAAVRSWEDQGALRAVRLFLEEHGVPAAVAARIYRAYGPGAIETLRSDPYGADRARRHRLRDGRRAGPGARHPAGLARSAWTPGCATRCTRPRATATATSPAPSWPSARRRMLGADADDRIDELAARGRLVAEGDRVFDPAMHGVETRLARHVRALIDDEPRAAPGRDRAPDGRLRPHRRPVGGGATPCSSAGWRSSPAARAPARR